MGFLDSGDTLSWEEVCFVIDYIKRHGIKQLLHTFDRAKDRKFDSLKWGDEVEYVVVEFDDENRRVRLVLRAHEILDVLQKEEHDAIEHGTLDKLKAIWRPEYGRFMIEGTPGVPYGPHVKDLLEVEPNMAARRKVVQEMLGKGEVILSLTHFPLLGVDDFTKPSFPVGGPVAKSLFVPDEVINPHPRFATLTRNIRERRGRKVDINIPIFMDAHTVCPSGESDRHLPGHVYLDAMAFGMGSSCVQCTFQCCNIDEARDFYDAFIPLAPIMLALSANCPILRGYLVDRDCRWDIISASVDSRRDEEIENLRAMVLSLSEKKGDTKKKNKSKKDKNKKNKKKDKKKKDKKKKKNKKADKKEKKRAKKEKKAGKKMAEKNYPFVKNLPARRTGEHIGASGGSFYGLIGKSRYGSVSLYIGNSSKFNDKYNDLSIQTNPWVFKKLVMAGLDTTLARHFAHLFIQDPLVVYRGKVQIDDSTHMDHFENIQSTNWQTVRFKPPPPNADIGWRVEFRSMELQFHDFENAAYVIFIALLTRVLMQFRLNLYMPISAVDMNMQRAQLRDSVSTQKFFWRKNVLPMSESSNVDDATVELTANEIINGSDSFIGLIPLIKRYMLSKETHVEVRTQIERYLNFISDRASGKILTGASWQRKFVTSHPKYRKDSVVSNEIAYDLLKEVQRLESLPSDQVHDFYRKK